MKRENPSIEICPGITRRTVANGKAMYQMVATLAAGSRMPEHRHAQEQIICASNCISAAPAALNRYLATVPAMSRFPTAPFFRVGLAFQDRHGFVDEFV